MTSDAELLEREMSIVNQGEVGTHNDLNAQWARVRSRLQREVGDVEYRTWLRQMSLAGIDGDEVTVHLPTRFLRDWYAIVMGLG